MSRFMGVWKKAMHMNFYKDMYMNVAYVSSNTYMHRNMHTVHPLALLMRIAIRPHVSTVLFAHEHSSKIYIL